MPSQHLHRLLCLVPDARKAALASWISANLDAGQGANWLSVGFSATGLAPATHWGFSAALTNAELRLAAQRLMDLANAAGASMALPANWDTRTPAQKRTILRAGRDEVATRTGIYIAPDLNDGPWDSPDAVLAARGLLRLQVAP